MILFSTALNIRPYFFETIFSRGFWDMSLLPYVVIKVANSVHVVECPRHVRSPLWSKIYTIKYVHTSH